MNVLLYLEDSSPHARHIREMIESLVEPEKLSVFVKYSALRHALADPFLQQHTIVVVAVESPAQLAFLAEDHILRNHHRLIAVIPQSDSKTIALGHRLKARYIADINEQNDDVATVLHNMMAKARVQESGGSTPIR